MLFAACTAGTRLCQSIPAVLSVAGPRALWGSYLIHRRLHLHLCKVCLCTPSLSPARTQHTFTTQPVTVKQPELDECLYLSLSLSPSLSVSVSLSLSLCPFSLCLVCTALFSFFSSREDTNTDWQPTNCFRALQWGGFIYIYIYISFFNYYLNYSSEQMTGLASIDTSWQKCKTSHSLDKWDLKVGKNLIVISTYFHAIYLTLIDGGLTHSSGWMLACFFFPFV